jgi:hypothetical protein
MGTVALSGLGWAAGCSNILGIESNRYVDAGSADAAAQDVVTLADSGGDVVEAAVKTGPWDCLGQQQLFAPGAVTSVTFLAVNALDPITQSSEVVDGGSSLELVTSTPLAGVPVRACSTVFDPTCEGGTGTPWETTDDAGHAPFTLPQSWNGFYQFSDPNLVTNAFYPGQMVSGQTSATVTGTLVSNAGFDLLEVGLPGVPISNDPDGGLGHVFVTVYDCQDHFASGVQFVPGSTSDGGIPTVSFYTGGMTGQELPTTTATATDRSGTGGILNAPVGILQITAILLATASTPAQTIGTVAVFINPATASLVSIRVRTE